MSIDKNRLLLELSKSIRDINYDIINPSISDVNMEELAPILEMVARSRAVYLTDMYDLAKNVGDGLPTKEQMLKLRESREMFEELLHAAQAVEVAVERGYLGVDGDSSRRRP